MTIKFTNRYSPDQTLIDGLPFYGNPAPLSLAPETSLCPHTFELLSMRRTVEALRAALLQSSSEIVELRRQISERDLRIASLMAQIEDAAE